MKTDVCILLWNPRIIVQKGSFSFKENGRPYSMTKVAEDYLHVHASDIIKQYLDKDHWDEASGHAYMEQVSPYNNVQSITTCKGNCFFLHKTNEESFCSIHRYAENSGKDPLKLKPYSCTLFPLDIIQDNGEIMLTTLTKETESFSRWGSEYNEYLCINLDLRKTRDLADEYFATDRYKPVWEWNHSLLERSFGSELVELLLNTVNSLIPVNHSV
jgi:hypothetical protein